MNDNKEIKKNVGESNPGSRYYFPVKYKYDEFAKCHVPYFDERPLDLFQMIQASKASVDITTIVQRATLGDLTVLHLGEKPYGDVSEIPDNLNDLNAFNKQAVNDFIALDPSIRKLFNDDVSTFAKAVENGSYINIINESLKPKDIEEKKVGEE